MPWAPAARHTSTASSTRGTRPPRELRSVATLFTLTERRIIELENGTGPEDWLPEVLLRDVHDFLRPGANFRLSCSFEHHTEDRLGSGIANQQTSLSCHTLLDARNHPCHLGKRFQRHLLANRDLQQHLGIARQVGREI